MKRCSFACSTLNPLSANPTKWSNTLKQFYPRELLNPYHSDQLYSGHSLAKGTFDETKPEATGYES